MLAQVAKRGTRLFSFTSARVTRFLCSLPQLCWQRNAYVQMTNSVQTLYRTLSSWIYFHSISPRSSCPWPLIWYASPFRYALTWTHQKTQIATVLKLAFATKREPQGLSIKQKLHGSTGGFKVWSVRFTSISKQWSLLHYAYACSFRFGAYTVRSIDGEISVSSSSFVNPTRPTITARIRDI